MTTKIGIDLPPELLEAARITQAANRNKLSIRERQNKINNKILSDPIVANQQIIEEQQRAVNEYPSLTASLPKSSETPFSWVIVESIGNESGSISLVGLALWRKVFSQEYNYTIAVSKSTDMLKRYYKQFLYFLFPITKQPIAYVDKTDSIENLGELKPSPYEVQLSESEINDQKTQPRFIEIVTDARSKLEILLKHSIAGTQNFSTAFSSRESSNSANNYSVDISLFAPTSTTKKVYFYMTYKSTGSYKGSGNGVSSYFVLDQNSNELVMQTDTAITVDTGNSDAQLFDLINSVSINGTIAKIAASTSYLSLISRTTYYSNETIGTISYESGIRLPGRSGTGIKLINTNSLPLSLRGLFTVMYEMPQFNQVNHVKIRLGSLYVLYLVEAPSAGPDADSPGESSNGVGNTTVIYNENILFSFSSINYADL